MVGRGQSRLWTDVEPWIGYEFVSKNVEVDAFSSTDGILGKGERVMEFEIEDK